MPTANGGGNGKGTSREPRTRRQFCTRHDADDIVQAMGGLEQIGHISKMLSEAQARGMHCPCCENTDTGQVKWLRPERVTALADIIIKHPKKRFQEPRHQLAVLPSG